MERTKTSNRAVPRSATKRGRPREFDADRALGHAMEVFWRKGYEGASLADLTRAMGINRPSLYAAFGDKASLFRRVMDRYAAGPACFVQEALAAPTARAVAERLLHGGIDAVSRPGRPRGCLAVQGALVCGDGARGVQKELAARRAATEGALRRRFGQAAAEGDLPQAADPADLAKYLTTLMHGLAVQAASGARREALRRVADLALRLWPT
jgi:AcrR family transcriptional regulator